MPRRRTPANGTQPNFAKRRQQSVVEKLGSSLPTKFGAKTFTFVRFFDDFETYLYKLATLTYCIKLSGQPSYLHKQDYQPTYSLRSASRDLLAITRPRSVASRACKHSAATTWNSIPVNIRNVCDTMVTFKCRLETFLYQAFAI